MIETKEADVWRYNFQKFGVATAHGKNETNINHFVLYWFICCENCVLADACGHVEFYKKKLNIEKIACFPECG